MACPSLHLLSCCGKRNYSPLPVHQTKAAPRAFCCLRTNSTPKLLLAVTGITAAACCFPIAESLYLAFLLKGTLNFAWWHALILTLAACIQIPATFELLRDCVS